MKTPHVPRSVLVTGCSSGIGAATARQLRDRGWTVYPTARKAEDLNTLREAGFDPVELDVSSTDSVEAAAKEVLRRTGGTLGGIVNNAGFGQPGALEDLTRDAMRYQFEVNLFGLQELTNQFIPAFRDQGCGRIVNVSSVVGRIALPFMGVYSASKFALEAFSDVLRVELVDTGIAVSLIEPGPIITDFRINAVDKMEAALDHANSDYGKLMEHEIQRRRRKPHKRQSWVNRPPEAVGEKVIHALESRSPRRRYCVTPPAYLGAFMRRFAPYMLIDGVLRKQVRKKRENLAQTEG